MIAITKELLHKLAVITENINVAIVEDQIYAYYTFTHSSAGSVSSIDFSVLEGIPITEFIHMNQDPQIQAKEFMARFLKYIDGLPQFRITFDKYQHYTLFALTKH